MKFYELHAHLNGVLEPEDVVFLAQNLGLVLNESEIGSLRIDKPVDNYTDYFIPWRVLRKLPANKENHSEIWDRAISRLASSGVTYAELRFSASTLARCADVSLDKAVGWIEDAVAASSNKHSVSCFAIISVNRAETEHEYLDALWSALQGQKLESIVGVDLTGDESEPVPASASKFYRRCSDRLGLGVSLHAGELGCMKNIRWAIEACGAQRIGHGLAAAKSMEVMNLIRDRGCCVECCLTSNMLSSVAKDPQDHPLRKMLLAGCEVVVCTDNPGLHGVQIGKEYAIVEELLKEWGIEPSSLADPAKHVFGGG